MLRWLKLHPGKTESKSSLIVNHLSLFFSEADSEDLVVIREVYDSDNAQEIFEMELERAIQVKPKKSS